MQLHMVGSLLSCMRHLARTPQTTLAVVLPLAFELAGTHTFSQPEVSL